MIDRLVKEGFTVEIGPHVGIEGYFASVRVCKDLESCDECGSYLTDEWESAGHGLSWKEALVNAEKITKGLPADRFDSEDFEDVE